MSALDRRCPICGKPADAAARFIPFCSSRCRTQDLANWASGSYKFLVVASEADEHLDPHTQTDESGSDA